MIRTEKPALAGTPKAGERNDESRRSKYCTTGAARQLPTFSEVHEVAHGRWPEILATLGIPAESLTGRHGPCPGCGGTDRFRFDDRDGRGSWICGGGGNLRAGDGFSLLSHVCGMNDVQSIKVVADYLGIRGGFQGSQRIEQIRATNGSEEDEQALWHELLIMVQYVQPRCVDRLLARDQKFRAARPEWRPMPDAPWQRELLAARRIKAALGVLYAV
jgi:hypothetical protein